MRAPSVPPREALAAALLVVLLAGGVAVAPARPGPGPLPLMLQIALVHAALLGPVIGGDRGSWAALGLPLSLPALVATSYGHDRLLPALALLLLALLAGGAGRMLRSRTAGSLFLPSLTLVFFAPYALHYLVAEFGRAGAAEAWLGLSPLAAADSLALPSPCVLALLFWPVFAVAAGVASR